MQCPRCQHENPTDQKFCGNCGTRLVAPCLACDAPNPPGQKFCGDCGAPLGSAPTGQKFGSPDAYTPKYLAEKILASRSALEGERKQVTVLFADVSGFTSLSERLDPEDVHVLMTRAFELMLAEVHRYEGTVNQFLGDGIMALFGAPIAHEDHAQRAVHAALAIRGALDGCREELQRRRGIDFQVRQGLNTGLVVVGSIGNDLRMDYTAAGDTTNVAARLQQMAQPGSIVIAEPTYRLTAGYFHIRPLGELRLKGKVEPVPAWEVVTAREARSRLEVEAARGLTALVGREREIAALWDCFEKARAGQGQMVFIVGEPGIGKSRLVYELRRRIGDQAGWLEGRCVSFGRSIPFHPLIDLLRRRLGIEDDDEPTVIGKIEGGILPLGDDLRPTLPYVRYLLAVDPGDAAVSSMDSQERRGELFYALRRLLLREAERLPQVMVCEDLHWTDKATEEYLALVADSLPASPVLLVLTYRTGYSHPFGERSYQTRIAPGALSTGDSVAMTRAMLAAERLSDGLQALIARKAEGNPFFVEELVKSLREAGSIRPDGDGWVLTQRLEELIVPDTIQDVIAARIDRLPEAPKRALQAASAIGREFSRRLLDRIVGVGARTETLLRDLTALELIYEKRVFPEFEYTFKHALTQEVAYGSLLVQRRKELHRLIAVTIEDLCGDRLAEQYEVLAHHFEKAEAWDKALDYLLKAGKKAAKAFANREALALYDQAFVAVSQLGDAVATDTLMEVQEGRASLYFAMSDYENAYAERERRLTLARRVGDRATEGVALAGMGFAALLGHKFDRALADSAQAIVLADDTGVQTLRATGLFTTGVVHTVTGQLEQARAEFDQVLAIARGSGDPGSQSLALLLAGLLKNWEGNYADALRLVSNGLRLARDQSLLFGLLAGSFYHGMVLTGQGDYDGALSALQEGLALSEKVGDERFRYRILNTLGWLHMEVGDLNRALDFSRRGAEGGRKRGDHETQANGELDFGDACLAKGDVVLAHDVFSGVHHLVEDPATSEWMRWRYSIHLFASLGELALARGDLAQAREHADQCLERATRTRSRKYLVKGWRLSGEIAKARRMWEDADRALREALAVAEFIGNPTQLWKTHMAIGGLHSERKTPDAAQQAYEAARNVIERIKSRLHNPGLRASLQSAPLIRRVYELTVPA